MNKNGTKENNRCTETSAGGKYNCLQHTCSDSDGDE